MTIYYYYENEKGSTDPHVSPFPVQFNVGPHMVQPLGKKSAVTRFTCNRKKKNITEKQNKTKQKMASKLSNTTLQIS
jgi:hypothetical protein